MDCVWFGRSLSQSKPINQLAKKQFNHEESGDAMQMAPMSLLSQPVVAATYYFSSNRRPTGGDPRFPDPSDRCESADGRQGTCYDTSDCVELGGTPMGRCPQEGVCCMYEKLELFEAPKSIPKFLFLY
ncbi:hypothetical protein JTE90_025121 [Oedothorax gibbosus]|uniref:Uncharacterized protein n=1 Tax=Oedothorax gibbosus TaxID=931172 RepID=A0AAV6UHD9_9ARAC|nr:hypothetical protein JTE90_025121 [Oedothorax gibbosus]